MPLLVGTSGFDYRDWRGPFYPRFIKPGDRLAFYAEHFDTVELNVTFYRMPAASAFRGWRDAVPDGFVFAVKASRYLTHIKRLEDPQPSVEYLMDRASILGDRLGPVLLQLPPSLESTSTGSTGRSRRSAPTSGWRSSRATRPGSCPSCATSCGAMTRLSSWPTADPADHAVVVPDRLDLPADARGEGSSPAVLRADVRCSPGSIASPARPTATCTSTTTIGHARSPTRGRSRRCSPRRCSPHIHPVHAAAVAGGARVTASCMWDYRARRSGGPARWA